MEKLGQHFLTNRIKLQKIVDSLALKAEDIIIEIGPGHGELTSFLIEDFQFIPSDFQLIAIEKDKELVDFLQNKFKKNDNIKIIEGDILKFLPKLISQLPNYSITNYKIVGNIPYYITGHLLRIIGELEKKPKLVILTIQKEVAERICSEPPRMNLLAASVQFWAEPKIIDYIPKSDFRPQPKVDSAILKLVIKQLSNYEITQLPNYYKLIKILFKQPRKTILNNLREAQPKKEGIIKILEELRINPGDRPQNLTIEQIKNLSAKLYQN
jgi:16S rRNA (adenine1518-N6/adenine1519-N6)-dimethyltransferase